MKHAFGWSEEVTARIAPDVPDTVVGRFEMLSAMLILYFRRTRASARPGQEIAQEIIDAFTNVYGERALMAPRKSGFQLLAWVLPGFAVIVGGSALAMLLKRWGTRSRDRAARSTTGAQFSATRGHTDATAEELAELEAAVRRDDDK